MKYKPPATVILYHGRNSLDHTITMSIDGVQYEYWFTQCHLADATEYLAHHISPGKALAFAKKHASKVTKEVR